MEQLTKQNLEQFKIDFETAFFESDNDRPPKWTFELKEETLTVSPNPNISLVTGLKVTREGSYKYSYFDIELIFELIFQKKMKNEIKNVYIKCVYYPLTIHTRGDYDYENYANKMPAYRRRHYLYPEMKILANYMVTKIISMIIEKGKESDILITEEELLPFFNKKIQRKISKGIVNIIQIDYYEI